MDVVITRQPGVLASDRMSRYQVVKRLLDLFICIFLLPFLGPVMLCCAVLIRLDSPGPAIFAQERIGKDGKEFTIYKFRTMYHNTDTRKHEEIMGKFIQGQTEDGAKKASSEPENYGLERKNAFVKAFLRKPDQREESYKIFKPFQASEVTRVGRILRKTSLDELPQILNVLKGEMSVIGPRPNVLYEVEAYQPWHYERLEALPGITGLAQVRGRSSISFDSIARYDIEYAHNLSLWLDLKILWWTVITVFLGKGAE